MNLVPKFMYHWMIDIRPHVIVTPSECPARISGVRIVKLKSEISDLACANYEATRGISEMPSAEYCPNCRYNTDNIRKKQMKDYKKK